MIKTLEELINSDAMENEYDGKEHVFDARDIPLDDPDCHVAVCQYIGSWHYAGGY